MGLASKSFAQEERNYYLYKGTVEKMPITFFLVETISGCPKKYYSGIYQYDKLSNWLSLNSTNNQEGHMILVEHHLTGILNLQKKKETLNGIWISPDGKRVLKVTLKEVLMKSSTKEAYLDKYHDLEYQLNDC